MSEARCCETCQSLRRRRWSTGCTHGTYFWCRLHGMRTDPASTCDGWTLRQPEPAAAPKVNTAGLMTREQAASYLGCTVSSLAKLACRQKGPRFAIVGKHAWYRREDLDTWRRMRADIPHPLTPNP